MIPYKNGSTKEEVFADLNCTQSIGFLNPYEACEAVMYYEGKVVVIYNIENNNQKIGFVKWTGGVKI